jgi:methionine-rich copper-binding protein CopC
MITGRIRPALVAMFLLSSFLPAYGHAILVSATPSADQVVKGPDVVVNLQFNSRIDPKRSRLLLHTPDGKELTLQISEESAPDHLNSKAQGVTSGSYILRWQVLANDGHISRGEVPFRVQ